MSRGMIELAAAFKALGDPVRLRLFRLIASHEELCVCHLTEALVLPQSTVSRQLGILRQAGLVDTRRGGKWMYYRAHDQVAHELLALANGVGDEDACADEQRLIQALKN